jgi:hypothetical protein
MFRLRCSLKISANSHRRLETRVSAIDSTPQFQHCHSAMSLPICASGNINCDVTRGDFNTLVVQRNGADSNYSVIDFQRSPRSSAVCACSVAAPMPRPAHLTPELQAFAEHRLEQLRADDAAVSAALLDARFRQ